MNLFPILTLSFFLLGTDPVLKQLTSSVIEELAALGFEINEEEFKIETRKREERKEDSSRDLDLFFRPTHFEAMHYLRSHAFHLPSKDGNELRQLAENTIPNLLGYYHSERKAIVIFDDIAKNLANDRVELKQTLAHELVHRYQDENQRLREFLQKEPRFLDQIDLRHSLLEGEAVVAAEAYSLKSKNVLLLGIDTEALDFAQIRKNVGEKLGTVYAMGTKFMFRKLNAGGWKAYREAFANPPSSTEELIHPEKLGNDFATTVNLPTLFSKASTTKLFHDDVIGELNIYFFLIRAGVARNTAYLAATGWDGDRLNIYRCDTGDPILLWRTVWDREEDAIQFESALTGLADGKILRKGRVADWVYAKQEKQIEDCVAALQSSPLLTDENPADATSTKEIEKNWLKQSARIENNFFIIPKYALKISVPEGWSQKNEEEFTLFSPDIDSFRNNIVVSKPPNLKRSTLSSLEEEFTKSLSQLFTLQPSKKIQLLGKEALWLEFQGTVKTAPKPLHFISLTFSKNSEWYQILATVSQDQWEENSKLIEKTLLSVQAIDSEKN